MNDICRYTYAMEFYSAIKKNQILSFAAIMQLSYISLVGSVIRICLQSRRHGFNPWVWKIPWRRKWQPTPVFLPEKSQGERSLVGYNPWSFKELAMTEQLRCTQEL